MLDEPVDTAGLHLMWTLCRCAGRTCPHLKAPIRLHGPGRSLLIAQVHCPLVITNLPAEPARGLLCSSTCSICHGGNFLQARACL